MGALDWLDARTGARGLVRRHIGSWSPPSSGNSWLSLGGVLAFLLALQVSTGILLLVHFVPDAERAFESVRRIMREVPYGWLVRLVHAHGANLLILLAFAHLLRVAWRADYKAPRELVWITGCLLFLALLGMGLTGYILPWSQVSYWATTVVTATFDYVPLVGEPLRRMVRGGELVGGPTFRRAFVAHVTLIPLALLGIASLHLLLVRRADLAPAPRRKAAPRADPSSPAVQPFFPHFALKYALQITAVSLLLVSLIVFAPDLFFSPESLEPADPFDTPANVKPEWYFLWAYALPRLIPEGLALAIQGLAVAALFALPFVDRGPERHALDRPLIAAGLVLAVSVLVTLTWVGYSA